MQCCNFPTFVLTKMKDRIRNDEICLKIGVTPFYEKIGESRWICFDHVQRRMINSSLRKSELF